MQPITVVGTETFRRQAREILGDDLLARLIGSLAFDPDQGDVIPGTGSIRKMRWQVPGAGKRGGARVIYYYHDRDMPLFLMAAYPKSKKVDLSADQKKALRRIANAIVAERRKKQKGA